MNQELADRHCASIGEDESPLAEEQVDELKADFPQWQVTTVDGEDRLKRSFAFDDFGGALDFTVAVGKTAEEEDHHPSLITEWGEVTVTWWTHKIGGLHQNDFVMAAKTDRIYKEQTT
jgi:4a-hydroxytetrahydrobiopterin dehydratase